MKPIKEYIAGLSQERRDMMDKERPIVNQVIAKLKQHKCDFENAKRLGRAYWCCPECGRDISLEYLYYIEITHPDWINNNDNNRF